MDLSKAWHCLPHDLLIAKVEAWGLDKPNLNLVNDYFGFQKQKELIVSSYSDWDNVTRSILQKYILRPLLFNVFNNDVLLFIEKSDKSNFAVDNTLFSSRYNVLVILKSL